MGEAKKALHAMNLIAITFNRSVPYEPTLATLVHLFGPVECTYGPIEFTHTEYYAQEMGDSLKKIYFSFSNLIDRTTLPRIKNKTNELEMACAIQGKRSINIDPGYITNDKLVLASTKDFFHRIYLDQGIYAEITLHYRKGCYRFFSWTYPDYKEPEFLKFLEKSRASYVHTLRSTSTSKGNDDV